ncbi:MAG: SPOR domain-containing protein [Saprospiraceae bacterium]|nr:SPOR domain-containing protein [Saprospiraceae bacterium]
MTARLIHRFITYRVLWFFLIGFFVINYNSFCQSSDSGKVEIFQDARVDKLIEKHVVLNKKQTGIPGYRVQIFFDSGTNSKNKANKVRAEFLLKYKNEDAYVIFQSPNYKVRVGDFRTRMEAQGFLKEISVLYPNAYTVKDEIQFPKLD